MGENTRELKMIKKYYCFLSEGFEAYEASPFIDVIGWSRETDYKPVDLVTTGFRTEYKCYWNLIAKPEILFDQIKIDDFDAPVIPGGCPAAGFSLTKIRGSVGYLNSYSLHSFELNVKEECK